MAAPWQPVRSAGKLRTETLGGVFPSHPCLGESPVDPDLFELFAGERLYLDSALGELAPHQIDEVEPQGLVYVIYPESLTVP